MAWVLISASGLLLLEDFHVKGTVRVEAVLGISHHLTSTKT